MSNNELINANKEANRYIDTVLMLSKSGFAIYDHRTNSFQFSGESLLNALDVPEEDIKTLSDLWQLIHPDDVPKAKAALSASIRKQQRTEVNLRLNNPFDEAIWVKVNVDVDLNENNEIQQVACFFTDVTQTLRIHNQLRKSLEESQKKLNAKTSFLGRLSHEIRTPMNAVIGISDALIHHHNDPTISPKLELIQSSAEKIIRIVDETLQHSKLDEDKLELNPILASPSKSVKDVCELWGHKAQRENIQLSYEISPNVPDQIIFDGFRYEQCLNNLISNAVKFTPDGSIQVILTTLEKNGQEMLVLAVKDTGIGMSPTQQANIFEAFTQADKSIPGRFGGTGLGMNITKRIIELMGGRISMKSEEGKGSVFALTLPIKSVVDMPKPEHTKDLVNSLLSDAIPNTTSYEGLRVLVADDNSTNHMVVSSLLDSMVKEIHIAENGAEAIEILGIEATLSIRGKNMPWSDVPIIALTADPQYQQKRLCKNIGMDWALAKPVKLTELLGAMDAVLSANEEDKEQAA